MKSISIFVLLIYWSIIIFAPLLSKENKIFKKETSFLYKKKTNK